MSDRSVSDLDVSPGDLRDAARSVDRSVDELTEVRRRLDTTGLTNEDWGSSWLTDTAHEAYQRVRAAHLASVRSAGADLQEVADRLRAAADRYETAEEASVTRESA